MDVSEAEHTITRFQEHLSSRKNEHGKLMDKLDTIRQEKIRIAENAEVQVPMKQGFVELHTTGYLSDYEDAVLIARSVVEDINKIILVR